MACLVALLAVFFPRLAFLTVWLARPGLVTAAFGQAILWPILGVIFIPFTSLVYVVLYHPGVGIVGWEWLWVGLAFLLDISHWVGGYSQRRYATRYSTGMPS